MNTDYRTLEYHTILEQLANFAVTETARERIRSLTPCLSELELTRLMRDTTQARRMLDTFGSPSLPAMDLLEAYLDSAVRGELLAAEQIEYVGTFLAAVKRLRDYLIRGQQLQIGIAYYSENLCEMEELRQEIVRCIRSGRVDDYASKELKDIRRSISLLEDKIRARADAILKNNKSCMAEAFVVNRSGHICLPVKKDQKSKIPGSVIDKSSTGATLFIEPVSIAKMSEELFLLKLDEENEERRILYTLTGMIADEAQRMQNSQRTIVNLDFVFAKGKLSASMEASEPEISTDRCIRISKGRHPLLDPKECVPLDFEIGGEVQGIVITGPNTGGKTVAIKTVGLLCLMACSGLHIPCDYAQICMNNQVLCDIGDGQNISENLSTFSAHLTNIIRILKSAGPESLVLLDELGSGTDPAEGMGIAVSILEQLKECGCLFLVTTHYPEVKEYAKDRPGIQNARMAFDRESLRPLYRLEIGRAGESCALYIAKRLGLPDDMLRRAAQAAYGEAYEENIRDLALEADGKGKIKREHVQGIERIPEKKKVSDRAASFVRGDSVMVYPEKKIGIVVEPADDQGRILVQIRKEKQLCSHKRLRLHVPASRLYPPDYDFSIVFDSVENRKKRHQMERKYSGDLEIQN